MKLTFRGAIDCDLHPAMPGAPALLPYLDEYWRDQIVDRHIDKYSFVLTSYPPNSPLSARPDWRFPTGAPGGDLDMIRRQALDPFGTRFAICNTLHGAVRASIVVPLHNPEAAVAEIERVAADRRFVQVLFFVMGEILLGRRIFWPIYAAAEKLELAIGIHAGGTYHHAPTAAGWPSHRVEDYVAQSAAFEGQVLSLLSEGVFQKFSRLKIVLIESGLTWLPHLMWRANKTWRGVRPEVPWIDRPPADVIREHVRVTLQPVDVPAGEAQILARTLEHIGSDRMLLFSTDYPHWHFDGEDVLPDGLSQETIRLLAIDNALDTFPRLREGAQMSDNASGHEESVR